MNLWRSKNYERSEIAYILQEVLEMSGNFEKFSVNFVKREANEMAHLCAKQASEDRHRCFWVNFILKFLRQCMLADCDNAG